MSSTAEASGMLAAIDRRLAQWRSSTVAAVAAASGIAAAGIVVTSYWLFLVQLGDRVANETLQFAGTAARLASRAGQFDIDDARITQLWGLAFAVVWGVVGYLLFAIFWRHCWNAGLAARDGVATGIRWVPVAGAVISIVERLVTLVVIRDGDAGVEMLTGAPAVVVALTWGKWVLAGITTLAVFGMIVAALARASQAPLPEGWADEFRRSVAAGSSYAEAKQAADDAAEAATPADRDAEQAVIDVRTDAAFADSPEQSVDLEQRVITSVPIQFGPDGVRPAAGTTEHLGAPQGTGVCCSGGGIRAASFALGAMSTLERTPEGVPLADSVLGSADHLASVSGGGYAAAAWRMAAGTGALPAEPIIGDPTTFTDEVEPFPRSDTSSPDLLTHVRQRRSYLSNGPGGLPRSILRVIAQMLFHITLILATLYVVSWPFGKLLGSWAVDGIAMEPSDRLQLDAFVGRHQWLPPVLTACAAAPLAIWRLFLDRTKLRRTVDSTIAGLLALAAGSAFVLVALPLLVELAVEIVPAGGANRWTFTGVWAAVVTAVWQGAKRYVRANARFLGGVFLALGLGVLAAFVIDWSYRSTNVLGQLPIWLLVLGLVVLAFVFLNPDLWSLHDFYRQQLAGTFATERRGDGLYAVVVPPPMSDYIDAEGPHSIICCAAARQLDTETGIAAVSMTFEPELVTLYSWKRTPDSQLSQLDPQAISHREFARLLPRGGHRLSSLMGAAAISGAAVAPAMGRKNLASTNALLAAFNARLGMWVPNPAYGAAEGRAEIDRRVSPRLVNMFKEIFGVYDEKDPNVYATDGGHWDNLGLVELIRRRCATIIAIDTSGDAPGTYTALKEAVALARHECGAEVAFGDDQWQALEVGEDGLVARNHMVGTVRYRDGHEARLLYVKAAVARTSSLAIQRFAASDRTFPNYSTGNQMLSDRRLTFLVRLGDEAMRDALEEHPSIVTRALGLAPTVAEPVAVTD